MPHYKNSLNAVYFYYEGDPIPDGMTQITDDEAEELRPKPSHAEVVRGQILALESTVTQRRVREALLSGDHSFIEGVDEQIAALRATL
jgi:hypothetical protein